MIFYLINWTFWSLSWVCFYFSIVDYSEFAVFWIRLDMLLKYNFDVFFFSFYDSFCMWVWNTMFLRTLKKLDYKTKYMRIINGFLLVSLLSLKHLTKRDFMFFVNIFLLAVVAYIGFLIGRTSWQMGWYHWITNHHVCFIVGTKILNNICLFLRNLPTIIWYEEFNMIRVLIVILGDLSMFFHLFGSFGVQRWKWGCWKLSHSLMENIEEEEWLYLCKQYPTWLNIFKLCWKWFLAWENRGYYLFYEWNINPLVYFNIGH